MSGTPDHASKTGRVALTPEMTAALRLHAERTGVGPHVLVKNHLADGQGITEASVYRWMNGSVKAVFDARYDLVLRIWESLPALRDHRAGNGPEIRAALRAHRERTGMGIVKLLKGRDDLPEGLKIATMENFYHGRTETVPAEHLDYVTKLWEALPERKRVSLTPEILSELRQHIERTGKGPVAVLRGAKDKPDGLKAAVVRTWFDGRATARQDHVDYMLKLYFGIQ